MAELRLSFRGLQKQSARTSFDASAVYFAEPDPPITWRTQRSSAGAHYTSAQGGIMALFQRDPVQLSIVVPVRNEAENILPLLAEIHAALENHGEFEVVYVDDGSRDAPPERLPPA